MLLVSAFSWLLVLSFIDAFSPHLKRVNDVELDINERPDNEDEETSE